MATNLVSEQCLQTVQPSGWQPTPLLGQTNLVLFVNPDLFWGILIREIIMEGLWYGVNNQDCGMRYGTVESGLWNEVWDCGISTVE